MQHGARGLGRVLPLAQRCQPTSAAAAKRAGLDHRWVSGSGVSRVGMDRQARGLLQAVGLRAGERYRREEPSKTWLARGSRLQPRLELGKELRGDLNVLDLTNTAMHPELIPLE